MSFIVTPFSKTYKLCIPKKERGIHLYTPTLKSMNVLVTSQPSIIHKVTISKQQPVGPIALWKLEGNTVTTTNQNSPRKPNPIHICSITVTLHSTNSSKSNQLSKCQQIWAVRSISIRLFWLTRHYRKKGVEFLLGVLR